MKIDPKFQITKHDNVSVDFHSELMNNYFPESTIEASENIRSLMVAPEQPFIFCLNKKKQLQGVLRTEGSASGWTQIILSEGKVTAFELEHNIEEDYFQIAKVEGNKVWVSDKISLSKTQFETLDKSIDWSVIKASETSEVINNVSIGVNQVLFATTSKKKDAQYYVASLEGLVPKPYTLPENGMKIVQFELGNFQYNDGVFLLYDIGKERSLIFQSFPDPEYDKTSKVRFENEEFINCFALVESDENNDILYVAGKKVHQYVTSIQSNDYEVNTLPGELNAIKKIVAARHANEHSIWSLDESGLHHQTNHFFDQKTQEFTNNKWTQPVIMVKDAEQFSCVKGKGIRNQLFSIKSAHGSELTRLWQDSVTTLWNQNNLTVKGLDSLKEVTSYSAHVRFNSRTANKTFQGLEVKLSAESNIFVYVNSKSYHIGPNHQVSIPLNVLAELTVICPVKEIASCRIFIDADFLKEKVAINLTEKVLERLQKKITSGDALAKAKKQNGEFLVAKGTDANILQSAAEGIQKLISTVETIDENSPKTLKETSFKIPNNSNILLLGSTPLAYQGLTLGDLLHSVWNTTKQAVEFVVEKIKDGVRFVIKIGEQIFNWIVKTVREIGSFIQKIFETIKVFFKDLFEFLAFIFDWDAIIATKEAFKDFTNEAVLGLRREIKNIKKYVDDTLDEQIGKFSPELVDIPDTLSKIDPSNSSEKSSADPRSNWLNSKKDYLNDSTERPLKERIPTEFSSVFENFLKELKAILVKSGEGFKLQFDIVFVGFKKVISGEMQFVDFLKLLLQKLAGLSLFLVKQLMDLIFTSLTVLLDVALVGLNKEWNVPIITELYKSVTKSDALTFLDVVCLFIAIPTTVLYKIGHGKAPFGEGKTKEEFVKSGSTIFQLNLT